MYLIVAPLLWLASLVGAPSPAAGYHPYTSEARPMAANGNNRGAQARSIQTAEKQGPQYLWWQSPAANR